MVIKSDELRHFFRQNQQKSDAIMLDAFWLNSFEKVTGSVIQKRWTALLFDLFFGIFLNKSDWVRRFFYIFIYFLFLKGHTLRRFSVNLYFEKLRKSTD